ncbi:MAG TPA: YkgJ family cysteine cluster protein [Edaphocola sp.]|nr:YkgJ family cysteine cluster protein [Edaphocola sp.]
MPDTTDYIDLEGLPEKAARQKKVHEKVLKKGRKNQLLQALPELDEEAFAHIDCLSCANCCKHYSPRFKMPDIKRIARRLRMKEGEFIARYLRMDEDGDYVVQSSPCPFLGEDNYCSIYEDRPRDCARYPYTSEDVLVKQASLSLKNASVCPAVFYVLERLSERMKI